MVGYKVIKYFEEKKPQTKERRVIECAGERGSNSKYGCQMWSQWESCIWVSIWRIWGSEPGWNFIGRKYGKGHEISEVFRDSKEAEYSTVSKSWRLGEKEN